ncbi:hypothetical protein PAHAL_7G006200 [Panicum hallii]|uniref:Uncharacterized protein n=1 Tax=Panicum hallii TaxID=206008 RepID=A0A2S3I4X2_9POAL|nr:hypothetical protein PAHAL_7G006200 [Panicum hallii]
MSSFPGGRSLARAVLPPPPPRRRCSSSSSSTSAASATRPTMSSFPIQSQETSVFELRINQMLMTCTYCCLPLRPDMVEGRTFTCAGGHIFCHDCTSRHEKACISYCRLLDGIIAQMKFKCNYCDSGDEYIPYPKFVEHQCNTRVDPRLMERQIEFVFESGDCILKTSLLVCSECELPLRPPIFRHLSLGVPICSACYRGDIANYVH